MKRSRESSPGKETLSSLHPPEGCWLMLHIRRREQSVRALAMSTRVLWGVTQRTRKLEFGLHRVLANPQQIFKKVTRQRKRTEFPGWQTVGRSIYGELLGGKGLGGQVCSADSLGRLSSGLPGGGRWEDTLANLCLAFRQTGGGGELWPHLFLHPLPSAQNNPGEAEVACFGAAYSSTHHFAEDKSVRKTKQTTNFN